MTTGVPDDVTFVYDEATRRRLQRAARRRPPSETVIGVLSAFLAALWTVQAVTGFTRLRWLTAAQAALWIAIAIYWLFFRRPVEAPRRVTLDFERTDLNVTYDGRLVRIGYRRIVDMYETDDLVLLEFEDPRLERPVALVKSELPDRGNAIESFLRERLGRGASPAPAAR